jgi:hypothetical protein
VLKSEAGLIKISHMQMERNNENDYSTTKFV